MAITLGSSSGGRQVKRRGAARRPDGIINDMGAGDAFHPGEGESVALNSPIEKTIGNAPTGILRCVSG